MSKKTTPDGFRTLTPYLTLSDATKAIQFYKEAFGAKEVELNHSPDGRVMHAILKIGDSLIMLSDEFPEYGCSSKPPMSLKGTSVFFYMYVDNVDTAFNKAVKAGAKVKIPVSDMFWGDRYGQVEDPFGHIWSIATHIGEFAHEEKECCSKTNSCC